MAITGDFKHTLAVYSQTETLSGGNATITKQFVGNIRAARTKSKEIENYGAERSNTNQVVSYRIRYRKDINTSTIITIDGVDFTVDSLESIGYKDLLVINLKAVK